MQYIETEITEYTESIWNSTLELNVVVSDEDFKAEGKDDTLAACVQITGSWEGTVAVICPMNLAKKVSAIMFGIEEDSAGKEEIQDAIGELANMTGGNIKSLLPEPCYLSLPAVAVTDTGFSCARERIGHTNQFQMRRQFVYRFSIKKTRKTKITVRLS